MVTEGNMNKREPGEVFAHVGTWIVAIFVLGVIALICAAGLVRLWGLLF